MSCITELLKKKGNQPYLCVNDRTAIESGGIYKGYEFLITFIHLGTRCGYVAIPPSHKLYEKNSFNGLDAEDLEVHGGVTFDGQHGIVEKVLGYQCEDKWIGFDSTHAGDGYDLELSAKVFPESQDVKEWIKIHKQTLEERGTSPEEIRTNKYMEDECKNLIDQIIEKYS